MKFGKFTAVFFAGLLFVSPFVMFLTNTVHGNDMSNANIFENKLYLLVDDSTVIPLKDNVTYSFGAFVLWINIEHNNAKEVTLKVNFLMNNPNIVGDYVLKLYVSKKVYITYVVHAADGKLTITTKGGSTTVDYKSGKAIVVTYVFGRR